MRRDEEGLVEAALARQPPAQHVGAVGERLDTVEHPGRRVLDHTQPDSVGRRRQRLGQQEAAPATGEHDAQAAVELGAAAIGEQLGDLRPELRSKGVRQAQVRGRALQPVEVIGQRVRLPGVDSDDLEGAVAAQQALVGGRDRGLVGGKDATVNGGQLCGRGGRVGHGGE